MYRWLRGRGNDTAPLTGQDTHALKAFVHLVELWGYGDEDGVRYAVVAMRAAVLAMQPCVRPLAKACIPMVLDWGHEARIWSELFPKGCVYTEREQEEA